MAFLNPKIDRDNIYMEMPLGIDWLTSSGSASSGITSTGSESTGSASSGSVLILRKELYGLKQAPRLWYEDIDGYLQSIGFRQSADDPNLYLQPGVLLVLYVDDLLIAHNSTEGQGHQVKQLLQKKYKMCDLGVAKRFLGIEIERTEDGGFSICQRDYINTIIRRFGLMDAKPAKSPLDLRLIWLTPSGRTNRPTARNTCQWSDPSCMRHLEVDQTSPSVSLLSDGTMCNLSRCIQQPRRECYDTSKLLHTSKSTTDDFHPAHNQ